MISISAFAVIVFVKWSNLVIKISHHKSRFIITTWSRYWYINFCNLLTTISIKSNSFLIPFYTTDWTSSLSTVSALPFAYFLAFTLVPSLMHTDFPQSTPSGQVQFLVQSHPSYFYIYLVYNFDDLFSWRMLSSPEKLNWNFCIISGTFKVSDKLNIQQWLGGTILVIR
jgi:hypothetical protein